MIGNVIQSRYLEVADYPTAAALSFLLMAFMLDHRPDLGADRGHRGAARQRGRGALMEAATATAPEHEPARAAAAPRAARARPACARLAAQRLRRAGPALPAGPDLHHHRLLLQQPARALQLHLAGVLARGLERPLRRAGHRRRPRQFDRDRGPLDALRDDPRDDHRAGARALRVPRLAPPPTSSSSSRWPRPRSCWAPRCCRSSSTRAPGSASARS